MWHNIFTGSGDLDMNVFGGWVGGHYSAYHRGRIKVDLTNGILPGLMEAET